MDQRTPYDHSLHTINEVGQSLNGIANDARGGSRPLDGPTAVGALQAHSNLAIASALLAVADAIRSQKD